MCVLVLSLHDKTRDRQRLDNYGLRPAAGEIYMQVSNTTAVNNQIAMSCFSLIGWKQFKMLLLYEIA